MLLDGEDSDEDFFHYKISANDWQTLQRAKAEEAKAPAGNGLQQPLGLVGGQQDRAFEPPNLEMMVD